MLTIEKIKNTVNELSGIDILEDTRTDFVAHCRWVFFDLCKLLLPTMSYEEIGGYVNRDHASVTYALGKKNKKYSNLERVLKIKKYKKTKHIYQVAHYSLCRNLKLNIDDIRDLDIMKLFHKSEILRLTNDYKETISNLNDSITLNQNIQYTLKILKMKEEKQIEFDNTRSRPFYLLNKNQ
jgi:hypothetical protein